MIARVRRTTIGFSAVPTLVARKVAAATAFWNVEGVTLRARGVRTHEFRVDSYGAPTYPELVFVTTRDVLRGNRDLVRRTLAAIAAGTSAALRHPSPVVAAISHDAQADASLIRREFVAVRPALTPPVRLKRRALREWAAFDVRFGILRRRPDVSRAFDFGVAPVTEQPFLVIEYLDGRSLSDAIEADGALEVEREEDGREPGRFQ